MTLLCSDWASPTWDEHEWTRVRDMTVQEILGKREQAAKTAQQAHCLECPNFVKHVRTLSTHTSSTNSAKLTPRL